MIKNVFVDYREQGRVNLAKKAYKKYNVEETRLDYGDFLFQGVDGVDVLFEYKTGSDFIQSVRNNHLFNQTVESATHYDYQFIVVDCFSLHDKIREYYYNTGIDVTPQQLNGAIASLNCFSTVCFVQSIGSAFDFMERQTLKILEGKPLAWKFGKKTVNPALNYLSSIKGLSRQAELICKKLNIHNLNDLIQLTEDDLTTVDGIGKKKARTILRAINGGRL